MTDKLIKQAEETFTDALDVTLRAEELLTKTPTPATLQEYGRSLAHLKGLYKTIETQRKELVDPLNAVVKKINAMAKQRRDIVEDLMEQETAAIREYERAQQAEAVKDVEETASVYESQGALEMAQDVRDQAASLASVQLDDLQVRKRWTYEVTSLVDLAQYWAEDVNHPDLIQPNKKVLNSLCKTHPNIPGVRFYQVSDFPEKSKK